MAGERAWIAARLWVALAFAWAPFAQGQAQGSLPAATAQHQDLADEQYVSGVVVDQTVTSFGHEFFGYFTASWRDQPGFERHTLSVRERPSARWGSRISIEQNSREVYSAIVYPPRANLKAVADKAAEFVAQRLSEPEFDRLFIKDHDLGSGDL